MSDRRAGRTPVGFVVTRLSDRAVWAVERARDRSATDTDGSTEWDRFTECAVDVYPRAVRRVRWWWLISTVVWLALTAAAAKVFVIEAIPGPPAAWSISGVTVSPAEWQAYVTTMNTFFQRRAFWVLGVSGCIFGALFLLMLTVTGELRKRNAVLRHRDMWSQRDEHIDDNPVRSDVRTPGLVWRNAWRQGLIWGPVRDAASRRVQRHSAAEREAGTRSANRTEAAVLLYRAAQRPAGQLVAFGGPMTETSLVNTMSMYGFMLVSMGAIVLVPPVNGPVQGLMATWNVSVGVSLMVTAIAAMALAAGVAKLAAGLAVTGEVRRRYRVVTATGKWEPEDQAAIAALVLI